MQVDDELPFVSRYAANKNTALRIPDFRGHTLFRVEFVRAPAVDNCVDNFRLRLQSPSEITNNGAPIPVSGLFPSPTPRLLYCRYSFPRSVPQRGIVDKSGPLGSQNGSDFPPRSLYIRLQPPATDFMKGFGHTAPSQCYKESSP